MLLFCSYIFYGWWDYRFLGLILFSSIVDYHCAKIIDDCDNATKRKTLLTIALSINIIFLGFFKYYNFFAESLIVALQSIGINNTSITILQILLPPGISFYTFQEIAYLVDVYNKKLEPSRSFVDYALFISFFPHLIAGPIQRPSHLLPQVQAPRHYWQPFVVDGVFLILSGLFRKCVIADNCALIADAAFQGRLGEPSIWTLLLGTYAFAWQIYGDFSGYSDIARGSAQLMGFHFMVNFRQPYFASSLQDFWHRWHISLSTWLRDYLYIPLGGNRGGALKTYVNLFTTMLLGGLWHGANWTFVIWGGLHGLGLGVERAINGLLHPADAPHGQMAHLKNVFVSLFKKFIIFQFVCLGWVFFRAHSTSEATSMLSSIKNFTWRGEYKAAIMFLVLFISLQTLVDYANESRNEEYLFAGGNVVCKLLVASFFIVSLSLIGGNEINAFIYFQF